MTKNLENFNHKISQEKWQRTWEEQGVFAFDEKSEKEKYYVLEMFPYPSGKIHMGHLRNYAIGDVIARFKAMKGYNVLHPMGFDSFGLPAENAALEHKIHPKEWTLENIKVMKQELKSIGLSVDWKRELATCLPDYFKHEQKIFIDFVKNGLAYQKESYVNWDPVDQTVLANEQVIDGRGWRSGALTQKKKLKQWFLKVSDFSEELLQDLKRLNGWDERVLSMQEKWIGKSEGLKLKFQLNFSKADKDKEKLTEIEVYTTRPDTIFGASFIAISSQHQLAVELGRKNSKIQEFIDECNSENYDNEETKNDAPEQEKRGIFTDLKVNHPFKEGEKLGVYIANFVLMDYGTGAVFGCPAHDQRDFDFATKYDLPIKKVVNNYEEPAFETQRLVIRKVEEKDFKNLLKLNKENSNHKFTPDNNNDEENSIENVTKKQIEQAKKDAQKGYFKFVIFDKKNNFIGEMNFCPDQYLSGGDVGDELFYKKSDIDFGYAILKEFQGQGFATEAAKAVIDFAFTTNNSLERLIAASHPQNEKSKNVLERCGFNYIDDFEIDDDKLKAIWSVFELKKEDFVPFEANSGNGKIINSEFLNDLSIDEAKSKIIKLAEEKNIGTRQVNYRLRDWGVSRQRYWGCPIPILYLENGEVVPEKEENLPVELPEDINFDGQGNPLAKHESWQNTSYVDENGIEHKARRETDTFDTFFESSWYFLRYISAPDNKPFDSDLVNKFMPVDKYIGGVEHAVLHLLYARFFVKALKKCGYLNFDEPFKNLLTQGMVCHQTFKDEDGKWVLPSDVTQKDGEYFHIETGKKISAGRSEKMSKSKKNVVEPAGIIRDYGADTARLFMLSDSPVDRDLQWLESGIDGSWKYVNRIWKLVCGFENEIGNDSLQSLAQENYEFYEEKSLNSLTSEAQKIIKLAHKTISSCEIHLENNNFNSAIAKIREFSNALEKFTPKDHEGNKAKYFTLKTLILLISPFMPHLAESCFEKMNQKDLVAKSKFPNFNPDLIKEDQVKIAVQVNGKLRGLIEVKKDEDKKIVEDLARNEEKTSNFIGGKSVRKAIIVPNKLVNFVI